MERKIIYLDDAIDALRYAQHRFTVADEAGGMGTVKWSEDVIYFAAAERVLAELPSADRPQGKWKVKSFHECFCHNCGFSFDIMKCEFLENMKYCPNCGVPKGADNE